MSDKVMLEITGCKECPNMNQDRHYTADSWEHVMDWKCGAADNKHISYMEWNDKDPAIPSWCPLRKKRDNNMTLPEEYQTRLNDCVYAVEANSNETTEIWDRFCNPENRFNYDKRYEWDQNNLGWLETIGHLDDRPICISIFIVKFDGYPVLFWDATSQLVDYAMIDEWFKEHLPTLQKTNAMNMHNAIHHIERLKEAA